MPRYYKIQDNREGGRRKGSEKIKKKGGREGFVLIWLLAKLKHSQILSKYPQFHKNASTLGIGSGKNKLERQYNFW